MSHDSVHGSLSVILYVKGCEAMGYTISYHTGGDKAHQRHNRRDERTVSKEAHIRQNGDFEVWIDENLQDAYKRLFQPAVEDYNKKQRRSDRRKENYYQEIKKAGKKHLVYETILTVGNTQNLPDSERVKAVFKDYVAEFRRQNPNMEIIGAYYHGDEQGAPHLHLDWIPVQYHCSRGMRVQTSLKGALGEMGIYYKDGVLAVTQWENQEREQFRSLCEAYGLEITQEKQAVREHQDKEFYVQEQRIKAAKERIDLMYKTPEKYIKKYWFGRSKIKMTQEEMALYCAERENIKKQNQELLRQNQALKARVAPLVEENQNLSNRIDGLEERVEYVRRNAAKVITSICREYGIRLSDEQTEHLYQDIDTRGGADSLIGELGLYRKRRDIRDRDER